MRKYNKLGAVAGYIVFLFVGLDIALIWGEFAGLTLANGIGLVELANKLVVVLGMLLGVGAIASLFAVLGVIISAVVYKLLNRG